jgi:DNA-directed RNA polymerase subunit RPC12/RpoP
MVVKCAHCHEKFEIADPVTPSQAEKITRMVPCAECGKMNSISWPKDMNPVPRKYQEG